MRQGLISSTVLALALTAQPTLAANSYQAFTSGMFTSTPRSAVYTDPQSSADEACQNQAAAANSSGRGDLACVTAEIDPEYCSTITGVCWHTVKFLNASGADVNGRFWNSLIIRIGKDWYSYYLRIDEADLACDDKTPCGQDCAVPTVGNPISTYTGNKMQVETDLVSSMLDGLDFVRYYNSHERLPSTPGWNGAVGAGWRHNYSKRLVAEKMQYGGMPSSGDPRSSGLYSTAQEACLSGWSALSGRLGNGLPPGNIEARYAGGRCELYVDGKFWRFAEILEYNLSRQPDLVSANILAWVRTDADGRVVRFVRDGRQNRWISTSRADGYVEGRGDGMVHVSAEGDVEYYDSSGRMLWQESRNGIRATLSYDADGNLIRVDGSTGAYLLITYTTAGRIASLQDHAGRRWEYTYDDTDRLVRVTAADGAVRRYLYEDDRFPHLLTGIVDELGNRYATWRYDAEGRAVLSEHAGGAGRVRLTFPDQWTTVVTNSQGGETIYRFATPGGLPKLSELAETGCSTCVTSLRRYEYDAVGNLVRKIENGRITEYGNYDTYGNPGYRIEGVGTPEARRIDFTYDARFPRKIATRAEASVSPGRKKITTYTYDEFGNLVRLQIDGYDPDGAPTSRVYILRYNGPYHQITQIDGPRTDVDDIVEFEYYPDDPAEGSNRARLRRVSVSGQVIRDAITYTVTGKVAQEIRPNGLTLTYDYYPGNDRLAGITETDGARQRTTRWTYLPTGEVETIVLADGQPEAVTMRFGYDEARRLTTVTDAEGNRVEYQLDSEGNRIGERWEDRHGNLHRHLSMTYDLLNRIRSIKLANETTTFEVADDGTVQSRLDGKGSRTRYSYDALQRLTRTIIDSGGTDPATADILLRYGYDMQNNLVQLEVESRGGMPVTTRWTYDDFGNRISEHSPDRGTVRYRYDTAGNLVARTDARGITTGYEYDALGRPVMVDYPGLDEDIRYEYDTCAKGAGRLCRIRDGAGITEYAYDAWGNITEQRITIAGITHVTRYAYDLLGRITATTLPNGKQIHYARDRNGRATRIELQEGGTARAIVRHAEYTPDGTPRRIEYGNGFIETRQYDTGGRLTGIDMPTP